MQDNYVPMKGNPSERLQKFVDILHTTDRVHNYYEAIVHLRFDILEYIEQDGINQVYVANLLETSQPKFSTMVNILKAIPIDKIDMPIVFAQLKDRTMPYEL